MNRKLIILVVAVVAIVAIVAVFVVPLLLGGFNPPVDVYARPTPSISQSPLDLLPNQVAGFDLFDFTTEEFTDAVDAIGFYDGDIVIEITRFFSTGSASGYMDNSVSFYQARSGSTTSVETGDQDWYVHAESGQSIFGWRKSVWVFEVTAPSEGLRNQVLEELPF